MSYVAPRAFKKQSSSVPLMKAIQIEMGETLSFRGLIHRQISTQTPKPDAIKCKQAYRLTNSQPMAKQIVIFCF